MTPGYAVFILMNNYFHDVATAMLLACGIALLLIIKRFDPLSDTTTRDYFVRLYRAVNLLAWLSVVWIVVGGLPRFLTFSAFEWPNAVEKHHEAGLLAKYGIAVVMMIVGVWLWIKASRLMKRHTDRSS